MSEIDRINCSIVRFELTLAQIEAGRNHTLDCAVSIERTRKVIMKARASIQDTDERIARWWYRPEQFHS